MAIDFAFDWDWYKKQRGTMMIGASPELELALFTLCFKTRPGAGCDVQIGGMPFKIITKLDQNGRLESAFYLFYRPPKP